MHRAPSKTWAYALLILLIAVFSHAHADTEPFPICDAVKPNVSFWTKVYTQYASRQAIIHDSHNLAIIYEVIDLKKPYDAPGMRKINRKRIKRVKAKYRDILKQLAANPKTQNNQCRRVAKLFGIDAGKRTFRLASEQVRSQIGQRDRFKAGLVRSGAYIEEIRAIFKTYGLPPELAYLPHVESSFNLKAYSKFGAAGIWQFTRSTGRRYMKVNYVLDERRDPIRATHAAAQLLRDNYQKLKSWPLAVTAYNHGATGMKRAQSAHGHYPAIFKKYKSRTFKFASRNFYSEFLAASQIAASYTDYFGDLKLSTPVPQRSVVLKGYAKFDALCRLFDIAPELVRSINPALRPPVYSGQKYVPKNYALRLPANLVLHQQKLAAIPDSLYQPHQKPSRFYTVQRGDTAGKIARMHRVKLSNLILANNLNRRATIYPKQTLRIPQTGPKRPVQNKNPDHRTVIPLVATKKTPPKEPIKVEAEPATYPQPVLAGLIPTPTTSRLNSVDRLSEVAEPFSAEVVAADVRFSGIIQDNHQPMGILTVEVEETLGHYAEWAGVRTQRIRRLNDLSFGRTLHLDQKVKIPIDKVPAHEFEEHRYEFHKRLQEDFFAVYRTGKLIPYRVERGDSYWTLCREKFEVPLWLLQNSNPEVDFSSVRINQKIWVPVIEKISVESPSDPTAEGDDMHLSKLRLQPYLNYRKTVAAEPNDHNLQKKRNCHGKYEIGVDRNRCNGQFDVRSPDCRRTPALGL